jgi:hypothetical protein
MTLKLEKCPRPGDTEVLQIPGSERPGVGIRVVFKGPTVGREWSRRMVGLIEEHREDPATMVREMVVFIRDIVSAFGISVEGFNGFAPNDPAEVPLFLEYLTYNQARSVIADILNYNCPDLSQFTGLKE